MKKHRFSIICSVLFSHTQHSRSILSYKGSIWVNYAGIVRFDVKKSKKNESEYEEHILTDHM